MRRRTAVAVRLIACIFAPTHAAPVAPWLPWRFIGGDSFGPSTNFPHPAGGGAPYGADREALSGLVQALLITKHMLFVGFSLRDTSFNQVATTVRRALGAADDAEEEPSAAPQAFGSAITLSERPFLAELWPDLESIPVSAGVAARRTGRRVAPAIHIFIFFALGECCEACFQVALPH
mgnify:CR=1 FL=1